MIDTLPLFHRVSGQPVLVLGSGDAAEAKRRLVVRAGGLVMDELQEAIDKGARLAFIAHDDPASAEADAVRARCAGLLVNVTDRPALCDFTVPSILDRSPVLIAVGTGGASAGLAKQLRMRLEALLPQRLGELARALAGARDALRARFPDPVARRRVLDSALAARGPLDPLGDHGADAVASWVDGAASASGSLVEIVLRSDDPDDLTLREARCLAEADVIRYERGVGQTILDRARADAVRLPIDGSVDEREPAGADLAVVILRRAACG